MAKVFISHRGCDAMAAERLALEISAAGHEVWLDLWNIYPGDSIVQRINSGLESADYVVVCYSSADATAAWMGREWMPSLARQLGGHHVVILPAVLTGRNVPAIIYDYKVADLLSNWSEGVAELLRAIR